jgi:hypothetical protein
MMENKKMLGKLLLYCNLRSVLLLVMTVPLLWLFGCEKTESFRNETRITGQISFLDVMDARALIIGGDENLNKSGGPKSSEETNSLFKITEDGVVQEIKYWQIDTLIIETEEGTEIVVDSVEVTSVLYPDRIYNADENHLIVCFEEYNEEDPFMPYQYDFLVRLSDGAVFQIPLGFGPDKGWNHYHQMFRNEDRSVLMQRDDAGYIYFVGKGDIQKISVQNPENITMQALTTGGESGEGVMNYRVNGQGHIIFNSGGISSAGSTRIRFSNGGLAYPEKSIVPFWRGFDNNFYFSYTPPYEPGIPILPVVEKLIISDGQVNYEPVGVVDHPSAENTYMENCYIFKMHDLNKIVMMQFADHMGIDGKVVAEVYNTENQVKAFSMAELGITNITMGMSSNNHYYLSGMNGNQPVILKVNPSVFPHSAENLLPPGSYDVYQMAVSSDDYVYLNALRMADGNNVNLQISPSGEITVLEDIGTEVIQLIQVN